MLLEIAVFNVEDAMYAANASADRIELCNDYKSGGITCSKEMLYQVRKKITIPIFPIIRPRSGNFCYSEDEFELMKRDILLCKQLEYDGVVAGILNSDKTIDIARMKQLVTLANPLPVTFHRAFDETINPQQALEDIIKCGCKKILTSGQEPTAILGKKLIKQLIEQANDRIIIMPGGGIRSNHINQLQEYTKAKEFHSAAFDSDTQQLNVDEAIKISTTLKQNFIK